MHFEYSDKTKDLMARLQAFMDEHIYPNERNYHQQIEEGDRWEPLPILETLKEKAREQGLRNLFLPESEDGAGLTNFEDAPLCQIIGRAPMAPEVLDRAIQVHGGKGVSEDTWLAAAWAALRTLRLADGPDEVHMETITKLELKNHP